MNHEAFPNFSPRPCVNCSHAGYDINRGDYTCELDKTPPPINSSCSDRNPRDGNPTQAMIYLNIEPESEETSRSLRVNDKLWFSGE